MSKQKDEALRFARALIPTETPEGTAVLVWSLPSKKNRWVTTAEQLAKEALALDAKGEDVYVGVSLRRPKGITAGRGGSADCTHLLAVALDLDVDPTGGGKGKHRFKSIEAACKALATAFSLPPSMLVGTGGGLHAWWLLREPLDLSDLKERADAELITRAWNMKLIEVARAQGIAVDSVFDLARVLRVPGTHNRKYGAPRPVHLID